jgi:uncharacterized iron-regulated membrane protein
MKNAKSKLWQRLKKVIGVLHLWLGLASGLVVFVVAITGAIWVFEPEIKGLFKKQKTEIVTKTHTHPNLSGCLQVVVDSLKRHPKHLELNEQFSYLFTSDEGYIGFDFTHKDTLNEKLVTFLVNPSTSIIEKTYGLEQEVKYESDIDYFFELMIGLHMHLLIEYKGIGREIVRWSTLIFFFMALSGIILWWPKNKAAVKQRFWFRWKENVRWKRMNYDLHNVLGFYACWIVIFAIVTGLMWTFQYVNGGVFFVASGGQSINKEEQIQTVTSNEVALMKPVLLNTIYDQIKSQYEASFIYEKDGKRIQPTIVMEVDTRTINAPIIVKIREPFGLEDTWYWQARSKAREETFLVDRVTGVVLSKSSSSIKHLGDFINHNSGAIHYGSIFGWPSKILMFFGCLVAASLPITGFYIWWGRRKKKVNPNSKHIAKAPQADTQTNALSKSL